MLQLHEANGASLLYNGPRNGGKDVKVIPGNKEKVRKIYKGLLLLGSVGNEYSGTWCNK